MSVTMPTIKSRAIRMTCLSVNRFFFPPWRTMSLVNMVPRQRNWESSEDMMAAKMPAVTMPTMMGLLISLPTIMASTAPGVASGGRIPVAHIPISTQGTHTIMIQMGCAMTVSLKAFALRAVSQCWKRCGNIPTLKGMNI